ncbi:MULTISPECIES: ABC transporter permease [Deinococcus]|uniref:ABC transporter permease n=1 Tax=Deinococcus rufus TaxID=2136097 RepID=A0ABV7ZC95_9DEIO|nr:ABC transporter permease [Deinococcus sp. AB2017081]WQE94226.1 ABC transporter permease [Deinococcus sp. AB2017081]
MPSERLRPALVWRIAARDLLSTIRDRRTLTATILMPLLLIPLFTLGLPLLLGNLIGGQQQARQKLGVVGTLPAALSTALTRDERLGDGTLVRAGVTLVPVTDARAAVQAGTVDAAVRPATAIPTRAGAGQGTLEVYAKLNNLRAQAGAYSKVQDVVTAYNRTLTIERLKALGLDAGVLTPVTIRSVDASPPQEQRSGQLAFLIPMLMLQFILSGAMATAVDATAGEKERGTLESLLVAPVRRGEVVAGKLLATTITALTSACFSVLGFILSGVLVAAFTRGRTGQGSEITQAMGGQLTLSVGGALALLGVSLSAALVISALLITVGIYARSFKEAQTYIAPFTLGIVLPAVLLQFSDFLTLGAGLYALPLFGGMLSLLEIVRGSVNGVHVLLAIAANLIGTVLLGLLARRSFGREEIIFRN